MNNTLRIIVAILLIAVLAVGAYWVYQNYLAPLPEQANTNTSAAQPTPAPQAGAGGGVVSAEGKVVPAAVYDLSFPQGGRVVEVLVKPGDTVNSGDPLFRLDTASLQASLAQAQASLSTANAAQSAAQVRLDQARQAAHAQEQANRTADWRTPVPSDVTQPGWYFDRAAQIASAQTELQAAQDDLQKEQTNLHDVIQANGSNDTIHAEQRLADARAAFFVARDVRDRSNGSRDQSLRDEAQRRYDIALSQLQSAQDDFDTLFSQEESDDILTTRARLAVAQERYDTALDRLNALQTGDLSLDIKAAQAALDQAAAGVQEAQAGVQAAQTALDQATLSAPAAGLVTDVMIDVGEVASPGKLVATLADTSTWEVETTDLAENDVVLVQVGMPAVITLDAFPDQTFQGAVTRIALASQDSRGSVTYAVRLRFDPGNAPIRWGMTAFVDLTTNP